VSLSRPLRLGIVAGEESGDLLGADLVKALRERTGREIELAGVGGRHLEAEGLTPIFDGSEIALMGISAVVRDLPRLVRRIGQTAQAIASFEPDCVVTIDSPAFGLRVAGRIKARAPGIPVVQYVCPSVWAWGPWRARKMKAQVDHVLCLLPFEPDALKRLDGPPGTFVGHRLSKNSGLLYAAEENAKRSRSAARRSLLVLPGSRRAEVAGLLEDFGRAVAVLKERGGDFEVVVPTLPRLENAISAASADWPVKPRIVTGEEEKWHAFGAADAALAASGTVTLELALAGVPLISCYRTDRLMRMAGSLITTWSAALPNLIAGWPVVSEYYDTQIRPERLAREIEQLWSDTPARQAQLRGFAQMREALATDRPAGEIGADILLAEIDRGAAIE
jgi:lipid-A-disaccharide synthase